MIQRAVARRWRLVRARRDAVPDSVRRFTARARQRRLRALRPWLIGLAGAGLVAVSGVVVWATPLLGVDRIRVEGNHLVAPGEVRRAAGVPAGTPLARVDTAAVARRVAGLPPVQRARVRRDWPGALVVRVVERTAVAAAPDGTGFVVLDRTGVGFVRAANRPAGLPLVRLASPGPDDPATRAAMSVVGALTPELRAALVAVVAEAPTRIRLELSGGRAIIWGDATENETKARVATSLLRRPGQTIDVSAPDVVTVR